jgi:hypothetical protein
MKTYFGRKDGRSFLTTATSTNAAYLQIGKALGIKVENAENVDLDVLIEAPKPGQTVEIPAEEGQGK